MLKHAITGLKKFILPLLAAAILISTPQIVQGASRSVEITEVSYGYNNYAKAGRFLPVNVTISNSESQDFSGKLSITARESDDDVYEYVHDITVPAGTEQDFSYTISVGKNANKITVAVLNDKSEEIQTKYVNLNIDRNNTRLFIGTLSDTPERLQYLDDVSINYGLLRSSVFDLDAESFPENSKKLSLFDVIVVSNFRIRDLNDAQTRALMEWVKNGGVMILGTGKRVDDTLGRFAPELLDDMYETPELMDVNFGPEFATSSPDDAVTTLYCVNASIHGGNVIIPGDGISLVSSVNKENGLIVITAFDMCDIDTFAQSHPTFVDRLLTKILGSNRLDVLAGEMYESGKNKFSYVESLINTSDLDRLPPISIYALSILAYILLAGPGLYLFLKSRELSSHYRAGVILLSICFTALIFAMGSRTRFKDTFYNYASIIDSDEDTKSETAFINLRNPYNKSYEVSIDNSYQIFPVTDDSAKRNSNDDETESKVRISYGTEDNRIGIGDVGAFTPKFFQLEKSENNETGEGFAGYVSLFGNELSGEVVNQHDYAVTDAVLMFYGRMAVLGDMEPGETVDLSDKELINIPLSDSYSVAASITGAVKSGEQADTTNEALRAIEKANVLAFYRDYFMNGYTTDARVLAFSKEKIESKLINDKLEGYGTTMLTSLMSVDNRDDDLLYRNTLIKNPVVISGDYSSEDNTMGVFEPAILEYMLGNDIELNNVFIEWPDEKMFGRDDAACFEGELAFYNHDTGRYDSIRKDKTMYSVSELEEYLSPSNTITIRYTYSGSPEKELFRTALPMISVVGNVRN